MFSSASSVDLTVSQPFSHITSAAHPYVKDGRNRLDPAASYFMPAFLHDLRIILSYYFYLRRDATYHVYFVRLYCPLPPSPGWEWDRGMILSMAEK